MQHEPELAAALAAIRPAMALCRSVQASIDDAILEKDDRSPVTVADYGSQALVCRSLAASRPSDPVVAEEEAGALRRPEQSTFLARVGRELSSVGVEADGKTICDWIDRGSSQPGQRFWTLDPIDGTKGFLRKGHYAVALALIIDGRVEVAVLGCPQLGDPAAGGLVYWAVKDQGARVAPAANPNDSRPVQVSDCQDMLLARLCESVESAHSAHDRSARIATDLGLGGQPVRLDSQAKYATVADGTAEIYLRLPVNDTYQEKIWDHAAGALVVSEAGGKVSDTEGHPLDFSLGRTLSANRGVVVTNGPLHERVLDAVLASTSSDQHGGGDHD